MTGRTTTRALTAAVTSVVLVGGLLLGAAGPATAKKQKKKPTKPTGVAAVASTPTTLTVRATVRYGTKFRVYAATTPRAVNASNYRTAPYTGKGRTPTVTLAGLPYRTEPYFLRYTAKNSRGLRYSKIATAYLTPPTPTGLTALTTASSGLALRWNASRSAERYVVTAATDGSFTKGVRTYTVTGEAHTFTPPGLSAGTTYHFRVRAANGSSSSASSAAVSAKAPAGAAVRIASYNLLTAGADGSKFGDGVVAPWSQRRQAAALLVYRAAPDVIAVQEGSYRVGSARQVDSFVAALNALGRDYVVARTEDPASTGPYVVYRSSVWATVGAGGRYELGNGRHAAYQVLQHRQSGARVLVTSSHLTPGKASTDAKRQAEATKLARLAATTAQYNDVPVVHAGDFNSNTGKNHKVDGPGVVFTGQGTPDSRHVATVVTNGQYNSANQYYRTPRASSLSIDHIYVERGIAVTRWQLLLDLDGKGRFNGVIPSDHNPVVTDLVLPTG